MNTIAYCRVSTDKQKESQSIDMQKFKLLEFAKASKIQILDWYVDDGFSAKNLDRPGMLNLLNNLKRIDQILVYDQSRLTRNLNDLTYLQIEFKKYEILVFTLTGPLDYSTPEGELQMNLLGSFDHYNRRKISVRTKHRYQQKKEEAEKEGKKLIWGRKEKIKEKDFDHYFDKIGIKNKTSLSKLLGVSRTTLYRYLERREV